MNDQQTNQPIVAMGVQSVVSPVSQQPQQVTTNPPKNDVANPYDALDAIHKYVV